MKNKKKLHSLVLASAAVVLFLTLVSSTASASITEKQITTNPSNSENPAIYGNTIVWQDDRNGNWDIYILDLSNKTQIRTTNQSDQTDPAIYGNKVVWTDGRNGRSDIYLQDLATKKQTRITTRGKASMPDIYGNRIVYVKFVQGEGENWNELYVYDLSTKKETQIPTMASAHNPAIYGNRIVWLDHDGFNGGDYNICVYDLSTKKRTQIANGSFYGFNPLDNPDIYGNKIVWQDACNAYVENGYGYLNSDIYIYDIPTKKKIQITANKSEQEDPVIYGNTIVWQDIRNGNWDIYAYDLITRQQIHITNTTDQVTPAIYGNKVVLTDYRNGPENPDIYMGTISFLPVAAFTASPTTGKHPLSLQFTDKSTDAYYYNWNFGDKTTSKDQNPVHKYSNAGNYTVSLTVKNAAGSNTAMKTNYITVK
jgi:beta propeller repeat protein